MGFVSLTRAQCVVTASKLTLLVLLFFGKQTYCFTTPAVSLSATKELLINKLPSPTCQFLSTTVTSLVDDVEVETTEKGLLKRDRYIATNRFAVRKGSAAKFEKRWATRKSKLAVLPGFKYFQLMRRVKLNEDGSCSYDEGESAEDSQENYVSFTIWNKKSDFSAWRNGEAFKEAHGGTSITAFLSTMVNSALVLRGAPRPAFYDGLLLQSTKPQTMPEIVDGWRNVNADGINTIPAESFIQMTKYFVPTGDRAVDFERYWIEKIKRDDSMNHVSGFVAFSLMRRDGQAKGHGVTPMEPNEPTYVSTVVFKDRKSFESWWAVSGSSIVPPTQIKNPETVYYEGTLVITNADGA